MKKIGIIVPVLNRFKKTFRFIQGLERQTYRNFCLYLCDSGSTDGTTLLPLYSNIQVKFIEATKDDWWTGATNKGIVQALKDECSYILTINDDSIITSSFLSSMVQLSEENDLDILGARVDFHHQPNRIWSLGAYSKWGTRHLFQLSHYGKWVDEIPKEIMRKKIIKVESLCGNGVLINKRVFDAIGYYDEEYCPHYHADSEFIMRANKNGFHSFITPKCIVYNDVNNSSDAATTVEAKPVSWLSKEYSNFKSAFFSIKSDLYYKPVFHIVKNYAPKGLKRKTLFIYYLHWFYVFYFNRFIDWCKETKLIPNFIKSRLFGLYRRASFRWNRING